MFILSSIHSTLELLLVNHSVNHNSGLKVLKNIKFSGEISNNSPNDLFRTNVHKTLQSFSWQLLTILQWSHTTSIISR